MKTIDDNVIENLSEVNICIYGAGYVAELFWNALVKNDLEKRVRGVFVTNAPKSELFHGHSILQIDKYVYSDKDLICLAVHESVAKELVKHLDELGISNYIWITPFITDLMMGDRFLEAKEVDIELFPKIQQDELGIAIRWSAIDQYYEKNEVGYNLYERGISIFSDKKTAKGRLEAFISLIKDFEEHGVLKAPICINDKYDIIDGEHRFAIALYHGVKSIFCKIYSDDSYHNSTVRLNKDVLMNNGFNEEEIGYLQNINKKINRMRKQSEC